jgi:hypothetical protein
MKRVTAGRFTLLMMTGVLGIAGWTVIFFYFGVGVLHFLAVAGALITFVMMLLLAVSQITDRKTADLMLPTVVAALVLGIVAMALALL